MKMSIKLSLCCLPILALATLCVPKSDGNTASVVQQVTMEEAPYKEVVCFVYHRFGDSRFPSTNISLDTFRAHLQYLKDQQFAVLTLGEAIDYMRSADAAKDQRVAVITVDDGYKTFLTGAMPILREFGYPATVFVNTETVGGADYLDWEEIKSLRAAGIEMGNHSHSHAYFLNESESSRQATFKDDVALAQQLFEKHLHFRPELFAYPYGEYDQSMVEATKAMGFKAAVAQNSGVMHNRMNMHRLPRFPMASSFATLEGFREKAKMHAMPVSDVKPANSVVQDANPPLLHFTVTDDDINLNAVQCFVQGGECVIEVDQSTKTIRARAKAPLKARRTLYTITAPSTSGGEWYWYSHLWVQPQVAE
jgi:peptidoglycan/xylan/chitin deacetylase (PgdA/CDA1 family)